MAAFGLVLVGLQFGAAERLKEAALGAIAPGSGAGSIGMMIPRALAALRPGDWALILAAGLLLAGSLGWELRSRRLSRDLARALSTRRGTLLLLAAALFTATRFYIAPGEFAYGDATVHISRIYDTALAFAQGSPPDWSFRQYCGYTLLQFYSPLFFWLGGLAHPLTGDPHNSAKLWLFLSHFASGFALYGWARAVGVSRAAAWVAALAYVLSFQHTHLVLWAGALPVGPIFVFAPLLYLGIEKQLQERSWKWIPVIGMATGSLFLSHHGHAAFVLQLGAVYLLARWIGGGCRRTGISSILGVGAGVLGGLLLGSDFLYSLIRESAWTYPPEGLPLLRPQLSLSYVERMLVWKNGWSGFTGAYIGITLIAFAAIGSWFSFRPGRRDPVRTALQGVAVMAAAALICAEQAGGRVGNWMLPPLSLLAGVGAAGLVSSRNGALLSGAGLARPRLALLFVLLLLLDLGTTTLQSNFRSDRRRLTEEFAAVRPEISPHRALLLYRNAAGESEFFEFLDVAGDAPFFPLGGFPQGAPRSLNAQLAMIDQLNQSPASLDEGDLDLLYLWDVSGLLAVTRSNLVPPAFDAARGIEVPGRDGRPVPLGIVEASPILSSARIQDAPPSRYAELQERALQLEPDAREDRRFFLAETQRWMEMVGLDRARGAAAVLLLHPDSPVTAADLAGTERQGGGTKASPGATAAPEVSLLSYEVEQRHASIAYEAGGPGYLRLAFSWYPTVEVRLDGAAVPSARGIFGGIVMATPAGAHEIEIVPTRSPRRVLAAGIGPLIGILWLSAWASARRRRNGERRKDAGSIGADGDPGDPGGD